MKHLGTVKIETARLILRRFTMDDAELTYKNWARTPIKVNRVEFRHDSQNPNFGGVIKKCGMVYEGTLRQSDVNNQGICDAVYYGILAREYFT
ncbi:MAG: GNAT family N-acetyltransferase [Clostridiales bacterium]|jgi:RimJ/RimL family protein N-acetyltransferase|nr:GNAT family N-acetyltransferase [Clostridiales bacterium]